MERFHKEFYELYQKYNAQNNATWANPEDMIEWGATWEAKPDKGQVIDADEK
jgi:hypothetical protein